MTMHAEQDYYVETFPVEDVVPCRRWSWVAYMPDGVEIAARGLTIGTIDCARAEAMETFGATITYQ